MKKTVVFDFDGVINSYKSGWQGATVLPDPPVDGIAELIADLRNQGYEVAVVSTRCASFGGAVAIKEYLNDNGIVVDFVTSDKPPALVYVDDRGITFDGTTDDLMRKITTFKAWWEKQHGRDIEIVHVL